LLALREDYRRQLTQVRKALGFERVRFHGLLDDDMSVLTFRGDQPYYSFFNIDSIMDFLLSIGMRPIIEVSFMPEAIASGPQTIFHYKGNITPPKNDTMWVQLIQTLVQHLVDRYGVQEIRQWPFEVRISLGIITHTHTRTRMNE
jgi:xylan 1,4-beta-xylosidase